MPNCFFFVGGMSLSRRFYALQSPTTIHLHIRTYDRFKQPMGPPDCQLSSSSRTAGGALVDAVPVHPLSAFEALHLGLGGGGNGYIQDTHPSRSSTASATTSATVLTLLVRRGYFPAASSYRAGGSFDRAIPFPIAITPTTSNNRNNRRDHLLADAPPLLSPLPATNNATSAGILEGQ